MRRMILYPTAGICCAALTAAFSFYVARRHGQPNREASSRAYADAASCIHCHASEAAGYGHTGMAHAFYAPNAATTVNSPIREAVYYHAASETFYTLTRRGDEFFEKRWQKGWSGQPDNVVEARIDYVMGSGNHVRTFLHREPDGTLIELPAAWYSELGGHLGMNPGDDNAHPNPRRPIAYECMFCHNGFPSIPETANRDLIADPSYTGKLPEGIDCQRCHGPGALHAQLAQSSKVNAVSIRASILNPARLPPAQQMEICEQCHLQTTSRIRPDEIRHHEREPFEYRAGEPLSAFASYFDTAVQDEAKERFEIVSGAYRLRRSQCYLQSKGALTCETCHDPHDLQKGPSSAQFYAGICMSCHSRDLPSLIADKRHPAGDGCIACHMPKQRTDDVVHAVMTDHLIQRRPPPQAVRLAQRAESSSLSTASLQPYRLDGEGLRRDDSLYDAEALVVHDGSSPRNRAALMSAIDMLHPAQPDFDIELGDALRHSGDLQGAILRYRQALALNPRSLRAERRLGVALRLAGQFDDALATLSTALKQAPRSADLLYERAQVYSDVENDTNAADDLHHALEVRPDFADAHNNLGILSARGKKMKDAEDEFRKAVQANPYSAEYRVNLGRLLAGRGRTDEALFQLNKAVELDPARAESHMTFAAVLAQLHRLSDAQREAEAGVREAPDSAEAHRVLGQVLGERDRLPQAEAELRAALRIAKGDGTDQLMLGMLLLQDSKFNEARSLLAQAAQSPLPQTAGQAQALLAQVAGR